MKPELIIQIIEATFLEKMTNSDFSTVQFSIFGPALQERVLKAHLSFTLCNTIKPMTASLSLEESGRSIMIRKLGEAPFFTIMYEPTTTKSMYMIRLS